jgi:hypothetical protein
MHSIAGPVEAFAIPIWRVEGVSKLFYSLFRATQAKNAFDVGCYSVEVSTVSVI